MHSIPTSAGVAPGQRSHAGRPNGEQERARPGLGRRGRTARRPADRPTRPPPPRSGVRHPSGTDCWLGSDPKGRGRGCASTPGPEPVPGPRTGGSLASRPERPERHVRTARRGRKTLLRHADKTGRLVRIAERPKCASDPHVVCAFQYGSKSGFALRSNPTPANRTSCPAPRPCSARPPWGYIPASKTKRCFAARITAGEPKCLQRLVGHSVERFTACTTASVAIEFQRSPSRRRDHRRRPAPRLRGPPAGSHRRPLRGCPPGWPLFGGQAGQPASQPTPC